MRKIKILGCGLSANTLTAQVNEALQWAELCLGAPRLLRDFAPPSSIRIEAYLAKDVERILAERKETKVAILLSGDSGFYSACRQILPVLSEEQVEVLPGISSLSYFFAKLRRPWQGVKLLSCHGRDANLADSVRRNASTFVLTSGNVSQLMEELARTGLGHCEVHVGENLGLAQERIRSASAEELIGQEFPSLTVLLIDHPHPDRTFRTGIEDHAFSRGEVPMSKAETRAIILSKLRLSPGDIALDLGCGSGSVTVEMALQAYEGRVIAVDQNPEALALTQINSRKFRLGNVETMEGDMLDCLDRIERFDKVFIGGGGPDRVPPLLRKIWQKNPRARVVASALLLETVHALVQGFQEQGADYELVQIGMSRAKRFSERHGMIAENPIFIISGES